MDVGRADAGDSQPEVSTSGQTDGQPGFGVDEQKALLLVPIDADAASVFRHCQVCRLSHVHAISSMVLLAKYIHFPISCIPLSPPNRTQPDPSW